jgi:putative oxidoreductase
MREGGAVTPIPQSPPGNYVEPMDPSATPPGFVILRTDEGAAPLVLRLLVGGVFLVEGVRKFTDPMGMGIARFEAMGFPFPGFFAPLVGGFEVVCGLLLLAGLGVRVAALPLASILLGAMAVHLVQGTSRAPGGILLEGVLLVMTVVLAWAGGGRASLDRRIWKGAAGSEEGPAASGPGSAPESSGAPASQP